MRHGAITSPVRAAALDWRALLRPGERVVCGQAAAEPLTLTRKLLAEWDDRPLCLFLGATMSRTFNGPVPAGMRFAAYGAMGHNGQLADRGLLDTIACHYSDLGALFANGNDPIGCVLLQVSPGRGGRRPSLGLCNDYLVQAARRARLVIAEVNPDTPWTFGAEMPEDLRIDHWVAAEVPPLEVPRTAGRDVDRQIARHVASLVSDGDTLQVGIGSMPDAALAALSCHRHLGLHSGVLGDPAAALIQGGAIDNSRKGIDAGLSVTNTVSGTAALYRWLHENPAVEVRHLSYTHDRGVLGAVHGLCAINSALQVDLSGQGNCESVAGRMRGGVGGLLDFARAARSSSRGGKSIIVMPSTTADGRESRIVASLGGNPVTLTKADADYVVTEHGIASLRNVTLRERARRLAAIAAPQFRESLARSVELVR